MHNIQPVNLTDPISPEMNLYLYFKQVSDSLMPLSIEILEFLVSSGTGRGWFPNLTQITERFVEMHAADKVEDALTDLIRHRLLYLDPENEQNINSIAGGISQKKTAFRAMTDSHAAFYLLGALDALTIAPMLQKEVSIRTTCPQSGETLELTVDGDGNWTHCEPAALAGFLAGWDGTTSIPTSKEHSRLFINSSALNEWQNANDDPDGLPLTQDTIRGVGMEMALALSELYARISIS